MGASAVILAANYTLDSLMLKYQNVDWADRANWNCNAGCAGRTLPFLPPVLQGTGVCKVSAPPVSPKARSQVPAMLDPIRRTCGWDSLQRHPGR